MKDKLRIIYDALTAFIISALLLFTSVLLSDFGGKSNIKLDMKSLTFTFFGSDYILDKRVPDILTKLLKFNAVFLPQFGEK